MSYAVATLLVVPEQRFRSSNKKAATRDMRVCEWPRDDWEQAVLLDGPFETLLEAQDAMRRRVIPALQAYEIWSEPAA